MTIWPPRREDLARPAYLSLAQRLKDAVAAGEIRPGAKLPTHRALAYQLGLSVQTISRAYEELGRLGIISGEIGRGSFVRAEAPEAQTPWHRVARSDQIIDFSMLVPVNSQLHVERFADALAEIASDPPPAALFSFRPRATLENHIDVALGWIARSGLRPARDLVLPTNGATSAMSVALMTATVPGDMVATESMGHHTLRALTGALGLRLAGLEMDRQGILPDALEHMCRTSPVKALFVMPNGLGPTVAVMGTDRRHAIAEIARKHNLWLIENDAWGPLHRHDHPPLAALAPERTFYFSSLTKCLLPGLRIGWLVVPERLISAARTRHLVTSWMATPLLAEIATRWIASGVASELLDWQISQLTRRNAIAERVLEGQNTVISPTGLCAWLELPEAWEPETFVAHARHDGVAIAAGNHFAMGNASRMRGVRICLGAGSEADVENGLSVIARLSRSAPEPALLAL